MQETGSLCYIVELLANGSYCNLTGPTVCPAGASSYRGRGPLQLKWNYNYGEAEQRPARCISLHAAQWFRTPATGCNARADQAGRYLGLDLLNNPGSVASNGIVSWKTALWLWMSARNGMPSCHEAITLTGTLSGRPMGFGLTTNILNGAVCILAVSC
jgi:hypothetical protein